MLLANVPCAQMSQRVVARAIPLRASLRDMVKQAAWWLMRIVLALVAALSIFVWIPLIGSKPLSALAPDEHVRSEIPPSAKSFRVDHGEIRFSNLGVPGEEPIRFALLVGVSVVAMVGLVIHSEDSENTEDHRATRPSAYRPFFMVLVILVVVGVSVWSFLDRHPYSGNWPLNAIRTEFESVVPPKDARPAGPVEVLVKYGVTAVSSRYTSQEANAALLEHYRAQLLGHGWSYLGDFSNGRNRGESYCKRKLLARVALFGTSAPRSYAFSRSWGDVSERQCP